MKKNPLLSSKNICFFLLFFAINLSSAMATTIDLTETTGGFTASNSAYVEFGPDINQAILYEEESFWDTYLSNNPSLGDPGIFIPDNAATITFDLSFYTSGNDSFEAFLVNRTGDVLFELFHDGGMMGAGSYQYTDISIDLMGLDLLGEFVGMEFYIGSGLGDTSYDSVLKISNANINENISTVPEPSTFFLLGTGLLSLAAFRGIRSGKTGKV